MSRIFWKLSLVLVLGFTSYALTQDSVSEMTRIGRGAVQSIQWHPSSDYVFVSTITGAWLYTPDLIDLGHIPDVQNATLSPDGRYIAAVDENDHIRLWDAITLEPLPDFDKDSFYHVKTMAWSFDGRYLAAAGSRDEDLTYVWDASNSYDTVLTTRVSGDKLLWSPQAHRFAIASSRTGGFSVFDIDQEIDFFGQPASNSAQYGSEIVWKDSTHILSLLYDENTEATLWDIRSGEVIDTYKLGGLPSAYYNHTGNALAVGSHSGVNLYNMESWLHVPMETESNTFIASVLAWSHQDQRLAVGTYSFSKTAPAEAWIINPKTGEVVQKVSALHQEIRHLTWSPDDRYLAIVDKWQEIFIYDLMSDEIIARNDSNTLVGDAFAWSPDGSEFMVAGSMPNVTRWDSKTITQLNDFPGTDYPASRIDWQPNGDQIAIEAREDSSVTRPGEMIDFQIQNTRTGIKFNYLDGPAVDFFDWHPDGTQFAILEEDTLTIHDSESGVTIEQVSDLQRSWDVQELSWSPSGRSLLMLAFGHGFGGSTIYRLDTQDFALSAAYLLSGTAVWTLDDELVSLRWGTWGDPSPPNVIQPRITRHTEIDPYSESIYLNGLMANTQYGFLSPHGTYAAAVDASNSGMLWNTTDSTPISMLTNVQQVVWSPDETHLLVQRTDGSLWLLNAQNIILEQLYGAAEIQETEGLFFWSPDNSRIAHLHDGVVDLWHLGE